MSTQPPAKPDDLLAYQEALRRGHQALLAGNARQALSEYQAAAALAAERALPHLAAGRALLALDRPADALAAFERAHEREPTDTGALQGKAEALSRLGRARDAAAVADQIQRLAGVPADDATDSSLPRAESLTLAADRALRDGRTDVAVGQWLAAARHHAGEGQLDAALDACQRALLADPDEPRVHIEMCRLYLARGWQQQAVERMELLARLVELDERHDLRAELAELARRHAGDDARFDSLAERLAGQHAAPPPPSGAS